MIGLDQLKIFFQSLSPVSEPAWDALKALFKPAVINKQEYFCAEGRVENDFAFLLSGVVRGFYLAKNGTEYNKHFFTTNSIIGGYSSLITGQPNRVIQQALTDCEILKASYSDLLMLYNQYPNLERLGRKFAERYFVEKEDKEFEIVLLDAEKRYALFRQRYPGLELQIPQYHVASYLGISATQLSRIRNKMANR